MTPVLARTLLAVGLVGSAVVAFAEVPPVPAKGERTPVAAGVNLGNCAACHGGFTTDETAKSLDEQAKLIPTEAYKQYSRDGHTKFIRFTEFNVWKDHDLHAKAFDHITPKADAKGGKNLAARMQEVLEKTPSRRGTGYEVHKAAECLTCHATDLTLVKDNDPPLGLGAKKAEHFDAKNGVSCEACHGFGTGEGSWELQHVDPKWRERTPDDKKARGLTDLRDAAVKAQKCGVVPRR